MLIGLLTALCAASAAVVSAHVVRGVVNPALATAFVSSPSGGADAPIKIAWGTRDTGLRVVCFYAANTSTPRADEPDWPRVTAIGFELPGQPSGFTLIEPGNDEWELVEDREATISGRGTVTLDFAIVTRLHPLGWFHRGRHEPLGIPPGQPATRGSGMRFCVSGPFPDTLPDPTDPTQPLATTIEPIINGVVVGFHRVEGAGWSRDIGLWDNPQRTVPLYPE
jgi:hypothetical protein